MRRERNVRSLAKAVSWQVTGVLTTTVLAYAWTGSAVQAGGFAVLSAAIGLGCYFLHERIWAAIKWGCLEG